MTEMELVLAETLISFLSQMAVGDYCLLGESRITRTPSGFDIENNGEGVSVHAARQAVRIAMENETPATE